jgi:hypothetical protein
MSTQAKGTTEAASAGWRFKAGLGIITLTLVIWLLVPLAAATNAPASIVAAVTGGIFIANKLLLLLAIAVMGKAGFGELKRTAFGYVSALAPNATVGPMRYRIGLVMFCLPIISAILEPYVDTVWSGLRPTSWILELTGDAMLIASFFVLGGNFWDKLRALFVRTATVVDAGDPQTQA